ncbi:MAG: SAM-dependent methyltransferase [Chloroflexi bacterium HGW-Chloroflexi-8]|nr:MAG: SAM-dependent methyltransferase [Chloroflexi bacterium HGW-Chloroflexi-8]
MGEFQATGTNWTTLWSQLARVGNTRRKLKLENGQADRWHKNVEQFNLRVYERWEQRDTSRQFVQKTLEDFPDSNVLDVGAGSGTWTLMMSPLAKSVTALDSSPAMLDFCKKEVENAGFDNVDIVAGIWPEIAAQVPEHDITLCSHAMYGCTDPVAFLKAMIEKTRKRIILLLRAPSQDGVMAQAAMLVWGHPYDSPNFQIAFQILLDMGIFPNVIMENEHLWKQWRNKSLEEALAELKGRLGLFEDQQYDQRLMHLLVENLVREGEEWVWPADIRTALVWWDV